MLSYYNILSSVCLMICLIFMNVEIHSLLLKMMCGPNFRITHLTQVVFFEF